ncbi:hypothetical protein [Nonomuraea sp. NPDC046570]|uniref:hypothetical protein n=1 Tax=Nonomuraea sp. NPDC046570 TaxID=3155255 RepID=UPI0033FCB4B3
MADRPLPPLGGRQDTPPADEEPAPAHLPTLPAFPGAQPGAWGNAGPVEEDQYDWYTDLPDQTRPSGIPRPPAAAQPPPGTWTPPGETARPAENPWAPPASPWAPPGTEIPWAGVPGEAPPSWGASDQSGPRPGPSTDIGQQWQAEPVVPGAPAWQPPPAFTAAAAGLQVWPAPDAPSMPPWPAATGEPIEDDADEDEHEGTALISHRAEPGDIPVWPPQPSPAEEPGPVDAGRIPDLPFATSAWGRKPHPSAEEAHPDGTPDSPSPTGSFDSRGNIIPPGDALDLDPTGFHEMPTNQADVLATADQADVREETARMDHAADREEAARVDHAAVREEAARTDHTEVARADHAEVREEPARAGHAAVREEAARMDHADMARADHAGDGRVADSATPPRGVQVLSGTVLPPGDRLAPQDPGQPHGESAPPDDPQATGRAGDGPSAPATTPFSTPGTPPGGHTITPGGPASTPANIPGTPPNTPGSPVTTPHAGGPGNDPGGPAAGPYTGTLGGDVSGSPTVPPGSDTLFTPPPRDGGSGSLFGPSTPAPSYAPPSYPMDQYTPKEPGKSKKALIATLGALALAGIGTGGFFAYKAMNADKPAEATSGAKPTVAVSTPPSTSPPDTLSSSVLNSAETDPQQLSLSEAFPDKKIKLAGTTYTRVKVNMASDCEKAASGPFAAALAKQKCSRVLRATYVDRKRDHAVTTGIAVLPTKDAAVQADQAKDLANNLWFRGLPHTAASGANRVHIAGGYAAGLVWGRYIVFSYATYADGHTATAKEKSLSKLSAAFRDQTSLVLERRITD